MTYNQGTYNQGSYGEMSEEPKRQAIITSSEFPKECNGIEQVVDTLFEQAKEYGAKMWVIMEQEGQCYKLSVELCENPIHEKVTELKGKQDD